ncbi:hypothetical protein HD598_001944 [Neomicrococcus aestuarii]|uniref:Uncharacterized protein n=1 Tax=Neomicrococcus aestuarii TaxID=556325 RepID=A0A7W8TUQ2_9MICC|nr:hypothetical protein [Neomicrococcus aestuarii]MBB5513257.1 hypothetical protein [Neomicrococcus aestuarii]
MHHPFQRRRFKTASNATARKTTARNATVQIAAVIALTAGLAACGDSGTTSENDAAASAHASASASQAAASASNQAVLNSRAGIAVSTGISQAASFGFNTARGATAAELDQLREPAADALEGVAVIPNSCTTAVENLNWSPAQSSSEAARTDFTQDGVAVTGSVEVAKIQDQQSYTDYKAAVKSLLGECKSIALSIGTDSAADTYPFKSVAPKTTADKSVDGVIDSKILWTRGTSSQDLRQQSLVLVAEKDGYAAMVSFVATSKLTDAQFTEMAQAILKATLAGLE